MTALMYAISPAKDGAWRSCSEVVTALLANGAQVNAADNNGSTPLSIARKSNQKDLVQILQKAGAR